MRSPVISIAMACPQLRCAIPAAGNGNLTPVPERRLGGKRQAGPRKATIYDHRRQSFDGHAAYVVVAFIAAG
jgi:hypothetical protein